MLKTIFPHFVPDVHLYRGQKIQKTSTSPKRSPPQQFHYKLVLHILYLPIVSLVFLWVDGHLLILSASIFIYVHVYWCIYLTQTLFFFKKKKVTSPKTQQERLHLLRWFSLTSVEEELVLVCCYSNFQRCECGLIVSSWSTINLK